MWLRFACLVGVRVFLCFVFCGFVLCVLLRFCFSVLFCDVLWCWFLDFVSSAFRLLVCCFSVERYPGESVAHVTARLLLCGS